MLVVLHAPAYVLSALVPESSSGISVTNVGHVHPYVTQKVKEIERSRDIIYGMSDGLVEVLGSGGIFSV